MTEHTHPDGDIRRFIVWLFCRHAARAGLRAGLSLKTMTELMQTAIYRETQRSGWSQRQAADRLGVSVRMVAGLSRSLKETFADLPGAQPLSRRIEFLLWAQPQTRHRVVQALDDVESAAVEAELERLVAAGDVEVVVGSTDRYRVTRHRSSFDPDDILHRLDGLASLFEQLDRTVEARFAEVPNPLAWARSLRFHMAPDPENLARLDRQWATLIDTIELIDRKALDVRRAGGRVVAMGMSVFRAPQADNEQTG